MLDENPVRIAAVDDSPEDLERCLSMLSRFEKESGTPLKVEPFSAGGRFLENFKAQYDVIILDINLQLLNGIDVAKAIREKDRDVVIIFVTNLAKYATEGYIVGALDFVLKPLVYESFYLKIGRALRQIRDRTGKSIVLQTASGFTKIAVDDIYYVEVYAHNIVFHLRDDQVETHGTLKAYEQMLQEYFFLRCNSCYLVNAKRIDRIFKYEVSLSNGAVLEISHPKRKRFIEQFKQYIAKGDSL